MSQVASPVEGEVIHNRLTHSLKVAQIARRITEKLRYDCWEQTDPRCVLSPDAAESAALAHDLGHPPFGHVGESTLRDCLQATGNEGFEGNAQSFRVVTKLAVRHIEHSGLNLTRRTLNGILKYPLQNADGSQTKWGAYEEETDDFVWCRSIVGGEGKILEADIMDWADDITYAVHDVDDFYRSGLIPLDRLARNADERDRFLGETLKRWRATRPAYAQEWTAYKDAFNEIARLVRVRRPYSGGREEQAELRQFGSFLISRYINPLTVDFDEYGQLHLVIPDDLRYEVEIIKQLNWYYVIDSSALRTQQFGQRAVVKFLFGTFVDDADCKLMPPWITAELDPHATEVRRAADVVASLTDRQALQMYRRLTGEAIGSIRDWM